MDDNNDNMMLAMVEIDDRADYGRGKNKAEADTLGQRYPQTDNLQSLLCHKELAILL